MMKRTSWRQTIGLLTLFWAFAGPAVAATVVGQQWNDHIELAGKPLILNGLGTRSAYGIDAYSAGLYLTAPARTVDQVLAAKGPKRLEMRMIGTFFYREVPATEFSKAIRNGFERHQGVSARQKLQDRMTRLIRSIDAIGTVRRGDIIQLEYWPGEGTWLVLNGVRRAPALPGDDLYDALLLCFIGDRVKWKALRAALLGVDPNAPDAPTAAAPGMAVPQAAVPPALAPSAAEGTPP